MLNVLYFSREAILSGRMVIKQRRFNIDTTEHRR